MTEQQQTSKVVIRVDLDNGFQATISEAFPASPTNNVTRLWFVSEFQKHISAMCSTMSNFGLCKQTGEVTISLDWDHSDLWTCFICGCVLQDGVKVGTCTVSWYLGNYQEEKAEDIISPATGRIF